MFEGCLPVSSLSHASSFHNNDWALFGPENLLDGHARALVETNTFISVHDWNQWVQFEFECPITLTRLYLTNAKWHGFWNGNIWISVKNESVLGVPWTHTIGDEDVCGKISQANLWDASTHELDCTQPMTGQFVILQMRKWERFRWNEVVFFDSYHELGNIFTIYQQVSICKKDLCFQVKAWKHRQWPLPHLALREDTPLQQMHLTKISSTTLLPHLKLSLGFSGSLPAKSKSSELS